MIQIKELILKLKRLRIRKYSAVELERESGISVSQISHIESGRKNIKLSTLIRYCEAIGVDIILKYKE